jgi:hypothetical protein
MIFSKRGRPPGVRPGTKPRPTSVSLARGSSSGKPLIADPALAKPPAPPIDLEPREAELFALYSKQAPWLRLIDSHLLLSYVRLAHKLEADTSATLNLSLYREMRCTGAMLGLDPSSRSRPLEPPKSPSAMAELIGKKPGG